MIDLLWRLTPWGIQVVAAIQHWAAQAGLEPTFTLLMRLVSDLGSVPAYILLVLLAAHRYARAPLARLALLMLFSLYVNGFIKELAGIPRPYLLAPAAIHPAVLYSDTAFPSGHAQMAATFWGALALARRRWAWSVAAFVWVALVGFSRLALGVHYPQDVIAGAILGLLLAAAGRAAWPAAEARLAHWPRTAQIGLAVGLPLLLTLADHSLNASTIAGATAGLVAGYLLSAAAPSPTPSGSLVQALPRLGLALLPAAALYLLLSARVAALPAGALQSTLAFALYLCIGLLTTGLPALLRRPAQAA